MRPVTTLDNFLPSSKDFHPDGLFSTEIFGRVADRKRMANFSYINLNTTIIHPTVYYSLIGLKGLYEDIINESKYAIWDDKLKDFVESDLTEGSTGYSFFVSKIAELKPTENESTSRAFNIKLLEKYRNNCLLSKVLVIPAGFRDYTIDDNGKPDYDAINKIYKRLLATGVSIDSDLISKSPEHFNHARLSMQKAICELYDYIKEMLEGKSKFIQKKWVSRNTFNGTRNVITTLDTTKNELNSEETANCNQTTVSLFQFAKAALPITIHHVRANVLQQAIPSSTQPAKLVNMSTLKSEEVTLNGRDYTMYTTDGGIEDIINNFATDAIRHYPVVIGKHYLSLIYDDGKYFRLMNSIDELPPDRDPKHVRPMSYVDLIYISLFEQAPKYPCLLTRYPITGLGSVYPTYPYLKSTTVSRKLEKLGQFWEPTGIIANQFPVVGGDFYNSMSPFPSKLGKLGADFDGDMANFVCLYSEDAKQEVKKLMNSREFYVDSRGQIVSSMNYETSNLVLSSLTVD